MGGGRSWNLRLPSLPVSSLFCTTPSTYHLTRDLAPIQRTQPELLYHSNTKYNTILFTFFHDVLKLSLLEFIYSLLFQIFLFKFLDHFRDSIYEFSLRFSKFINHSHIFLGSQESKICKHLTVFFLILFSLFCSNIYFAVICVFKYLIVRPQNEL